MKNLDELAARIERVALDPDEVSAPLSRILRPILARLGVEPELKTAGIERLVTRLRMTHTGAIFEHRDLAAALAEAEAELDSNLSSVERACVVNEQPMVTQGAWLRRMYEVIVRARRAIDESDEKALGVVASLEPARLLPPLAVAAVDEKHDAEGDATARRLVELELASVDKLIEAADAENELLGRQRRLLEGARQALLDASGTMPLDERGTSERLEYLAQRIARVDRLEAAGLSSEASLTHQLRQALTRGERQRAYAALCAIQTTAAARADERTLDLTSRALDAMCGPRGPIARAESLDRSAQEMFGVDVRALVKKQYEDARKRHRTKSSNDPVVREIVQQAAGYFTQPGAASLTAAAVAVDGCFEVGGALLPTRVVEHETIIRAVRHPTPDLALLPALEIEDVQDAVIEDPRTLILDLAAGRLLARRYIAHEDVKKETIVMRGEIRAYVLDGSGSMIGPRARMRDAIVASELLTLRRRLTQHARLARVALFYRYFTDVVGPPVRVDGVATIDTAMTDVIGTMRAGGTNIQAALVATIQDIAAATQKDGDLAQAQIVVVTDGMAEVDEQAVTTARETLGKLPIGLSVIALGEQNAALRGIVARQRGRGERAFYHFISDATLQRIANGEIDPGGAIHPPPVNEARATPEALEKQIGEIVEEITARKKAREVEALESLDTDDAARREAGLTKEDMSEAEIARARALYRDRAALVRQFDRWFPPPVDGATPSAMHGDADVEAVTVLLSTVAEMIGVVGGSDLARMADAIDLLERLLPDARLTPARYQEVLTTTARDLAAPLAAVRAAAGLTRQPANARNNPPQK